MPPASFEADWGSMKLKPIMALAATIQRLAGRSSTPTKLNAGVMHTRTFNFVCWRSQPEPGFINKRETVQEQMQTAAAKNQTDLMNKKTWPLRLGKFARVWLAIAMMAPACFGFADEPPPLPPISTVDDSPHLPGKFVWADLVTDDVPAAKNFYSGLFGWKFSDYGGYLVGKNDDRPLCGIFYRPRPADKSAKPRWFGYLSVSNVKRAVKTATGLGAKLLAPAKKLPDRGEQAVFTDPEGAVFGVVKSSSGDLPDFLPDPGDWIWIELVSRDARKAGDFYKAIGGYEVVENTSDDRLSDYVLASEGFARATILTTPPQHAQVNPTWLLFVRVKSVSESVAKATTLGGKVLIAPKPELLDGRLAVVADPTGAAIGLMEWPEDMVKGDH